MELTHSGAGGRGHVRTAIVLAFAVLLAMLVAVPAHAAAGGSRLLAGERLVAGQELVSPSGALHLVMQGDGNLVLYSPGSVARWQSGTDGNAGAFAQLQADGNFVIYSAAGVALWHTSTYGKGGAFVQVQDDGNVVLYSSASAALWQSGTKYFPSRLSSPGTLPAGSSLQSPNGAYELRMQTDGNLALYGPAGVMWNAGTQGTGANRLVVQTDGNLVLYNASGAVWHTSTYGKGASFLQVQDDGNVVLYAVSGGWTWQTGTYPGGPATTQAQKAIAFAAAQIGKPYVWGAAGPSSYDCSGLTLASWASAGVALPRTSAQQYASVRKVPYSERQPGDLIFYGNASGIYHVAIYVGNDRMIEAPKPGLTVRQIAVYSTNRMGTVGRPVG